MRKRKYYLYLIAEERRLIFNALLAYRNKLIAQGRYTDIVDEVMIKVHSIRRQGEILAAVFCSNTCKYDII